MKKEALIYFTIFSLSLFSSASLSGSTLFNLGPTTGSLSIPYSSLRSAYATLEIDQSEDQGKTLKEAEKEEEEEDQDLGQQSSDTIQTDEGNSATIDKSQIDPDNNDNSNNNNQNSNNNNQNGNKNNGSPASPNTDSSSNPELTSPNSDDINSNTIVGTNIPGSVPTVNGTIITPFKIGSTSTGTYKEIIILGKFPKPGSPFACPLNLIGQGILREEAFKQCQLNPGDFNSPAGGGTPGLLGGIDSILANGGVDAGMTIDCSGLLNEVSDPLAKSTRPHPGRGGERDIEKEDRISTIDPKVEEEYRKQMATDLAKMLYNFLAEAAAPVGGFKETYEDATEQERIDAAVKAGVEKYMAEQKEAGNAPLTREQIDAVAKAAAEAAMAKYVADQKAADEKKAAEQKKGESQGASNSQGGPNPGARTDPDSGSQVSCLGGLNELNKCDKSNLLAMSSPVCKKIANDCLGHDLSKAYVTDDQNVSCDTDVDLKSAQTLVLPCEMIAQPVGPDDDPCGKGGGSGDVNVGISKWQTTTGSNCYDIRGQYTGDEGSQCKKDEVTVVALGPAGVLPPRENPACKELGGIFCVTFPGPITCYSNGQQVPCTPEGPGPGPERSLIEGSAGHTLSPNTSPQTPSQPSNPSISGGPSTGEGPGTPPTEGDLN